MSHDKPIYVTSPTLPDMHDFVPYLEKIWSNRVLTNNGPFSQELEKELSKHLGVEYISLFVNGTAALTAALTALQIKGKVITTPFTFVATSHSLLWNNIQPIFVDINPDTFNLDPEKVEEAITEKTTAILPVHCYGNPCNVEKFNEISKKYNLKVIYDAAHAFGVKYNSETILKYGDISVLSFHATKVFNTFEGGAIATSNMDLKKQVDEIRNFGFKDNNTINTIGMNGKMTEIASALGLLQLKNINEAINDRKIIDNLYRKYLKDIPNINCIKYSEEVLPNYSYFPILIEDDCPCNRDELYENLCSNYIYPKKYFYPLVSDYYIYQNITSGCPLNLKNATSISEKVLCLPISSDMDRTDVERVIACISSRIT